jgi:hypothetical protein
VIDKTCAKCGVTFPVKPYRFNAKYCSYDCYWGKSEGKSEKECGKCKRVLPIVWFRKIKRGWQTNCRDCRNKEFKNWSRRNDSFQRFRFYEWRSKKVGRAFEIDLDYFKQLIENGSCFYCGSTEVRLGLDRIDSSVGYTKENILPCCRRCNVAKNDMPIKDFLELCRKIAKLHGTT